MFGSAMMEDLEAERERFSDDHIGPLGMRDDDGDWYWVAQEAHAENEKLRKKIKVLESHIKYLEGKCHTKVSG